MIVLGYSHQSLYTFIVFWLIVLPWQTSEALCQYVSELAEELWDPSKVIDFLKKKIKFLIIHNDTVHVVTC